MINAGLMTSARGSWNTPSEVLDLVRKVAPIGLDPCSNPDSIVRAETEWSQPGVNGLLHPWRSQGLVFVNPEYGRKIGAWTERCAEFGKEDLIGDELIALLPCRTDAKWFRDVWTADAICFWRGRLKFLGAPSSAPFPSCIAYWGQNPFLFAQVFSAAGKVVFP